MTREDDLLQLLIGAHAVTRIAALETRNEAPAAQWRALTLLRDSGPQRVGDLAVRSRISQPGMTRLIGQLGDAGYVQRTSDPHDARVQMVSITPAGDAALEAWHTQLSEALRPHFAALDDAEWDVLAAAAAILASVTDSDRVPVSGAAR